MVQPKIQRKHLYTPLRYPGGKTSLWGFFESVIERHKWQNLTYIEPYAGGAGAALSLLITGKIQSIVINDFDPAIFCFWKSILNQTDDFIDKIRSTKISIENWQIQKLIYGECNSDKPLELGFATFFLNRTNRSGILNAGPVGGKSQSGTWKLDARYKIESSIAKIKLISSYRKHISVSNKDGLEIFKKYADNPEVIFYIDPPYFSKGHKLYFNSLTYEDHEDLAWILDKNRDKKWLLTYDNIPEIRQLYKHYNKSLFDLNYSAHHGTKSGSEIMILSDAISPSVLF